MRFSLILPVMLAALGSCQPLRPPATPQQAAQLAERPAQACPDTVCAPVRIAPAVTDVPAVVGPESRPVADPVAEPVVTAGAIDREQLDSLLTRVERLLDTIQQLSAPRPLPRPAFADLPRRHPVRADALKAAAVIWWRDTGSVPIAVVSRPVAEVTPCDTARLQDAPGSVPLKPCFYDPRGWPCWLLMALGMAGGAGLWIAINRA